MIVDNLVRLLKYLFGWFGGVGVGVVVPNLPATIVVVEAYSCAVVTSLGVGIIFARWVACVATSMEPVVQYVLSVVAFSVVGNFVVV